MSDVSSKAADHGMLAGIRVLDLTVMAAGPICTMLLADLGADVVKVEQPGSGDISRGLGTVFVSGVSSQFLSSNRNKRSVALNLRAREGRDAFLRLARSADVVAENFRPGTVDKLGVGYDAVRAVNPRVVYCSISAFGQRGPYSGRPANDPIVQAIGGLMAMTGPEGGDPTRIGNPYPDFGGAMLAAYGICAALYHRQRTGEGQRVEVSLLDGVVFSMIPREGEYWQTGQEPPRLGTAHPSFAPYQAFRTRDGRHVFISVFTEKFWQNLCVALGRPELAADPRFTSNTDRVANRAALTAEIDAAFATRTAAEWVAALDAADVPCGPVQSLGEALDDPQIRANGLVIEMEHPVAGRLKALGHPVKFSAGPARYAAPPPVLGAHTEEVLRDAGFTAAEVAALRAAGAI